MEHSWNVGGNEELAVPHADDHGRPEARGDNLVRHSGGEHAERKCARKPLDGAANGHFKRDGLTGNFRIFLNLFDQVSNDLGVGFSDEFVALRGELMFEVEVVFDDAVVHYDEAAGAVAMWVGVFFSGAMHVRPSGCGRCRKCPRADARGELPRGCPACPERGAAQACRASEGLADRDACQNS